MKTDMRKYFTFLGLTLILSVPFYILGAVLPVSGLPFELPISFLMIFVPFILSLIYAWRINGKHGILAIFEGIFDAKKTKIWIVSICAACMPITLLLTYFFMKFAALPIPLDYVLPYWDIPMMIVLYFLGAIPEEFGWTYTLTGPFSEKYGPEKAGVIIGGVWAIWHIIPWSWAHSGSWILGMVFLNILMRIIMVYFYIYGGRSLFLSIIFHTTINVSFGLFPVNGSYVNTWIVCAWMALIGFSIKFIMTRHQISKSKFGNLTSKST
jgi:membrane protease YdiL (CAAX protease family)